MSLVSKSLARACLTQPTNYLKTLNTKATQWWLRHTWILFLRLEAIKVGQQCLLAIVSILWRRKNKSVRRAASPKPTHSHSASSSRQIRPSIWLTRISVLTFQLCTKWRFSSCPAQATSHLREMLNFTVRCQTLASTKRLAAKISLATLWSPQMHSPLLQVRACQSLNSRVKLRRQTAVTQILLKAT